MACSEAVESYRKNWRQVVQRYVPPPPNSECSLTYVKLKLFVSRQTLLFIIKSAMDTIVESKIEDTCQTFRYTVPNVARQGSSELPQKLDCDISQSRQVSLQLYSPNFYCSTCCCKRNYQSKAQVSRLIALDSMRQEICRS